MATTITTGIENVVATTGTTPTTTTKSVGKDEFMKLLLAQLKNQNPLEPLDGSDFAAQLAQFSSLEQLSNLNDQLKAQSVNQMTLGYAQSANMIGKEVVANSGNTVTANGGTIDLSYNLAKDADTVTISVIDKDGKVVKTWTESNQKAGLNKTTWDCSDVEKGEFTYQVYASDKLGNAVYAGTTTVGTVTAVHFRSNQIMATVNGREIPLGDIIEIRKEATSGDTRETGTSNNI
jgi:flagellar basal-body rod modification protein FlgD